MPDATGHACTSPALEPSIPDTRSTADPGAGGSPYSQLMLRRLDLKGSYRSLNAGFWPSTLPLGKRSVIYGHNGSGKSSFASLLLEIASDDTPTEVMWEDEHARRHTVRTGKGPITPQSLLALHGSPRRVCLARTARIGSQVVGRGNPSHASCPRSTPDSSPTRRGDRCYRTLLHFEGIQEEFGHRRCSELIIARELGGRPGRLAGIERRAQPWVINEDPADLDEICGDRADSRQADIAGQAGRLGAHLARLSSHHDIADDYRGQRCRGQNEEMIPEADMVGS